MIVTTVLSELDKVLLPRGFKRRASENVLGCWVRRTLMTNRAVVVIKAPDDVDPALFARNQKGACRKAAGFFLPFLYEIGLQIVVVGPPVRTEPTSVVDTYSNQVCVLQSVHVVDVEGKVATSGATWGQFVTGEIQSAIARALRIAVGGEEVAAGAQQAAETDIQSAKKPPFFRVATVCGVIAVILLLLRMIVRLFSL